MGNKKAHLNHLTISRGHSSTTSTLSMSILWINFDTHNPLFIYNKPKPPPRSRINVDFLLLGGSHLPDIVLPIRNRAFTCVCCTVQRFIVYQWVYRQREQQARVKEHKICNTHSIGSVIILLLYYYDDDGESFNYCHVLRFFYWKGNWFFPSNTHYTHKRCIYHVLYSAIKVIFLLPYECVFTVCSGRN